MGEHRPGNDQERDQGLLSLSEAATLLGLSKDAVRMRVRRGSLRSVKGENGVVYVYRGDLGASLDTPEPQGEVEASRELIEVLREQVEDLRARLDRETEANRENRRIIAGLIERVPELESGPQESPAEPRGSSESASRSPERGSVPESPEVSAERPWWRRIFGS